MVHESSHGAKDGSEEAFDNRGNPPDKSKTGGWLGAGLILGTVSNLHITQTPKHPLFLTRLFLFFFFLTKTRF